MIKPDDGPIIASGSATTMAGCTWPHQDAGRSPIIRFRYGFRASGAQLETVRGRILLDESEAWGGGPFQNGTTSVPESELPDHQGVRGPDQTRGGSNWADAAREGSTRHRAA